MLFYGKTFQVNQSDASSEVLAERSPLPRHDVRVQVLTPSPPHSAFYHSSSLSSLSSYPFYPFFDASLTVDALLCHHELPIVGSSVLPLMDGSTIRVDHLHVLATVEYRSTRLTQSLQKIAEASWYHTISLSKISDFFSDL